MDEQLELLVFGLYNYVKIMCFRIAARSASLILLRKGAWEFLSLSGNCGTQNPPFNTDKSQNWLLCLPK